MVTPTSLRPGNWIYPTGRSKYVVVTGHLLWTMERMPEMRDEFEGIELTGELLEAAGFEKDKDGDFNYQVDPAIYIKIIIGADGWAYPHYMESTPENYNTVGLPRIKHLHQLQNLFFCSLHGSELPLPESAKIIPQVSK